MTCLRSLFASVAKCICTFLNIWTFRLFWTLEVFQNSLWILPISLSPDHDSAWHGYSILANIHVCLNWHYINMTSRPSLDFTQFCTNQFVYNYVQYKEQIMYIKKVSVKPSPTSITSAANGKKTLRALLDVSSLLVGSQ